MNQQCLRYEPSNPMVKQHLLQVNTAKGNKPVTLKKRQKKYFDITESLLDSDEYHKEFKVGVK